MTLLTSILYGILSVGILVILIPVFILIERQNFNGSFRIPERDGRFSANWRQFYKSLWSAIIVNPDKLSLSVQVLNLAESAFIIGIWLVLPYQLQRPESCGLVWICLGLLTIPVHIFVQLYTICHINAGIGLSGAMKNSLMCLSNFLILIFPVLIILTYEYNDNLVSMSFSQSGFYLKLIPRWNFFRSPLLFLSGTTYLMNLIVILRTSDDGFKPFEFQPLAELQADRQTEFSRFLSFNRMAVFFSMAAIFVLLYFGGWQMETDSNLSFLPLWGGLFFFVKSAIILLVCLALKARLPLLSLSQILRFYLKIQTPVLAAIWLIVLIGGWFE